VSFAGRLAARLRAFQRTSPLSDDWGYGRGHPIDRFYIDSFLRAHAADVQGNVLEVKEPLYTQRYGHEVARSDVLDIDAANERATIVGDLGEPNSLPAQRYDCVLLTQTLQYVLDAAVAVANVHRALTPGGVVLATVPGVNRADEDPASPSLWSFTAAGAKRLFEETFGGANVAVQSYGNVLASSAFLYGMAREELTAAELDAHDVRFPVIVAVRALRT
jgi:SAM-dependent methyltransferase